MEFFDAYPALLVIAIFFARICDVSLGTVRTILLFRGRSWIAAGIGFVEVLIWITAAGQVLKNIDAWYLAVAYAGGFSAGNIVGIWLEGRMAIGLELVRIVSENPEVNLSRVLREKDYSVVQLEGTGHSAVPVEIAFVIERRRKVPELLAMIERTDPHAYCTISDIKRHEHLALLAQGRRNGLRSVVKKR